MIRLALLLAPLLPGCSGAGGTAATFAATFAEDPRPVAELDREHSAWTALLREHVRGDRVDYAGLREDRDELEAYLASLAAVTPEELAAWGEADRFAFWINVYNAYCAKLIVDAYPTDSIRDLGGKVFGRVWDEEFIPLAAHHPEGEGDPLSLDDVEHGILRPTFRDARLHAAVNCASVSCPPLRNEAYVGARLDEQLDEQMRGFLADPTRNRFLPEADRIVISEIFRWFEGDFARDAGSVRAYVARYAPTEETAWIEEADVESMDYDWSLNDVERR